MEPNIAAPAALIGDPGRAAMLQALLDGRAQPASALAWAAGLTAQAASNHLTKLVEGGLLKVERQGRHRYYRLHNAEVAHALEALALLAAPIRALEQPRSPLARALRGGRCCYGHLAGRLGVGLTRALEDHGHICVADDKLYAVTPAGAAWFAQLGVDVAALRSKRGVARQCLDWTERQHHLAGPLGVALCDRLEALGWIVRDRASRAADLTPAGREALREHLNLDLDAEAVARAA